MRDASCPARRQQVFDTAVTRLLPAVTTECPAEATAPSVPAFTLDLAALRLVRRLDRAFDRPVI